MIVFLSLLAAAAPTAIYVGLIYTVDRYEKEPIPLLLAAFVWGAVPSILFAFLANSLLSAPFYLAGPTVGEFVGASAIAPLIEESIKGAALIGILLLWRHEIDSPLDGIVYGAMVGMGFAMVENVLYFLTVYEEQGVGAWTVNIFLRAIVFGLNHALFSAVTGLGIAISRLARGRATRLLAPVAGWFTAVLLHAIHNASAVLGGAFCLLLFATDFGGILITLVIIFWAIWQEGTWIARYLGEEVEQGVISGAQQRRAASATRRIRHSLDLLLQQGPATYLLGRRFYQRCAELAYKKHHYALFGHDQDLERAERLRDEIAALARRLP